MPPPSPISRFAKARAKIGARLQDLRRDRHWSQRELARRLAISQPHLSKVEHGISSLTAEQFLFVLSLFNVPASHFVDRKQDDSDLQNALARFGATHLFEIAEVLPSEVLADAQRVVREALVDGSPRFVTALAPVVVRHAQRIHLPRIYEDLARLGYERRLGWLIENVVAALEKLRSTTGPNANAWLRVYRRSEGALLGFLGVARDRLGRDTPALDVLDDTIRTQKTIEEVERSSSPISQRWRIVTTLYPTDFVEALRAADLDV